MAVTGSDKFEGPQESPYHLWPLESDLLRNECEEDLLSPVVFNICGPGNATLCSGSAGSLSHLCGIPIFVL